MLPARGACGDDRGGDASAACARGARTATSRPAGPSRRSRARRRRGRRRARHPRSPIGKPADYPASPSTEARVPRDLSPEQPPTHQPAGATAVTAPVGERGMTASQAAEAPPHPPQTRSLPVPGGTLDERKRWPQCLPPWSKGLSSKRYAFSMRCVAAHCQNSASQTQTLTTGRTLVRVGRASAKGSSSRSSVTSRLTFLRMTARAALPNTASATTVAAPMPSQNHTGMVILSAFPAASKPTVACIRSSFG
jgi:hypothetical protein